MGFYAPAQIVRDAQEHGVEVRPIDINASFWDNSLARKGDGSLALRIGFRPMDGFREDWAKALEVARANGTFDSMEALSRRAEPNGRASERERVRVDGETKEGHGSINKKIHKPTK